MGYIAKEFLVEKFDLKIPTAYGAWKHMEVDLPAGVCRLDLHWFPNKKASDEKTQPLDVWSYPLPPIMIADLFKNNNTDSAFALAYKYIRQVDERFKDIDDDLGQENKEENV